jgi:hypothetical protein
MYIPNLYINYWAVLVSMAVYLLLGWLWYSPRLFGNIWLKEMHYSGGEKPGRKEMVRSMILALVGCFLTSLVLTHSIQVWRPSVWWGINGIPDSPSYLFGLTSAFFIWIGYYLPVFLNNVAFEKSSWKLFGINAGYHLVGLQVIGQILANWWL